MDGLLTVSDVARALGEKYRRVVRPRDISDLFYRRELREDVCPIVGGRRLIPPEYLGAIETCLQQRNLLPRRPLCQPKQKEERIGSSVRAQPDNDQ
jgi:hypothetical protein